MSHLALPSSARASPSPSASASSPRKGGKKRQLDRVLLDEEDDVDENDLIALPTSRRRLNEEYDEEDEGEDEEHDHEHDGDVEGEGEAEEGGAGAGAGEGRRRERLGGKDVDESIIKLRLEREKERKKADEIDKKGKKRRAETFLLRDQLDQEQAKRFDTFSTVAINKNAIKRLNRELYDQHCSPQVSMVVAGMAKIFVADVIELAKDLQPHSAHPKGPLQPYHLKLARMHLEQSGLLADRKQAKRSLFKK
ncbi:uncharacterized protein IL334_000964 [Kwoniella shivajii]|uniref:TAFII28-like protein domain-containing protein n=1 Tax=Kwoniella shivajii TaxID=564305 RepID=A0ABZ1CRP7_9TREE|nr:hypothetical protein IL334_000964 [Kwoniella shivajii]